MRQSGLWMVMTLHQRLQKTIKEVIPRPPGHGLHRVCVVIYSLTVLESARFFYPEAERLRILPNTSRHSGKSLPNFLTTSVSNAPHWQKNGIAQHHLRRLSGSKWDIKITTTLDLIADTRASIKIPAEVAKWTQYMQRKTGAVVFVLAGYTNSEGELGVSRYVMSRSLTVVHSFYPTS